MENKTEYTINCDCTQICDRCKPKSVKDGVPEYYKGKDGYEARKVVENFDLNYNLGTATTYILRAYHKHDTAKDCIKKAIHHLQFELEIIENGKA